jgi:sugar lactone lactonase YvrE
VIPAGRGRRLNDGSTDPAGRFVVGTLSLDGRTDSETLVRLEHDGSLTTLDRDLQLSNGLAWSADGTRFYSIDSERHTVFVRPYDPVSGDVGERRVHLRVDDGFPDGMAIDAEDHLWIAVWGAGEVRRFAPDGTVVATVRVPAPHTSCPAFAGDDLRTLVITNARGVLAEAEREAHPRSGQLFTIRTDVPGLPVPFWSGRG